MAAAGLSPKLFAWQIPELEVGIEVMEAMLEHGLQQKWRTSERVGAVSRIVCLCRGVRGIHGMRRLGVWAKKHESVQFFKNKQDGAVWFLEAGRMLQK